MHLRALTSNRPIVIAHRGASAEAPENTMAAFRRAIAVGADGIELDIHLTSDRHIIVIHDATLDRTTDGHGAVCERSLTEIKRLSAGQWFERGFAPERIPTLADILDLALGKVLINIEIKFRGGGRRDFGIVEECLRILRKHRAEKEVVISSFSMPCIRYVKSLRPGITTGALYHPLMHLGRPPVRVARRANADMLILNGASMRKSVVRKAHERSTPVAEYTIDTVARLARSVRFGVDAVITNDPRKILRLLSHR